jgi:hypothetical protein
MTEDQIDDLGGRALATVSLEARAAVESAVEHMIEREYGTGDPASLRGASQLATAAITLDIRPLYVETNGTDRGVESLAAILFRILVRDGLDQRRCPCVLTGVGHHHVGQCSAHYEADVPPIDGERLCGTCHVAVYATKTAERG